MFWGYSSLFEFMMEADYILGEMECFYIVLNELFAFLLEYKRMFRVFELLRIPVVPGRISLLFRSYYSRVRTWGVKGISLFIED